MRTLQSEHIFCLIGKEKSCILWVPDKVIYVEVIKKNFGLIEIWNFTNKLFRILKILLSKSEIDQYSYILLK